MRVLVTGSVDWTDPALVDTALDDLLADAAEFVVITGMAVGVDEIARKWAQRNDVEVLAEPLEVGGYPEPMHRYNKRMLQWHPDLVIACKANLNLESNPSAGTEHMCLVALAAGVSVRWLQASDQVE